MLKVYKDKFRSQSPIYQALLMDRLPTQQQLTVKFIEVRGFKYLDIALVNETPYHTVKANYRHGMARIYREILRDEQAQAVAPYLQGVQDGHSPGR